MVSRSCSKTGYLAFQVGVSHYQSYQAQRPAMTSRFRGELAEYEFQGLARRIGFMGFPLPRPEA